CRQLQTVEEYLCQLSRRCEVERLTRSLERLLFQRQHPLAEDTALRHEDLAIDQDALAFHPEEHLASRQFDPGIDEIELGVRNDLGVKHAMQAQRDVRIFGGVLGCL